MLLPSPGRVLSQPVSSGKLKPMATVGGSTTSAARTKRKAVSTARLVEPSLSGRPSQPTSSPRPRKSSGETRP